MPRFDDDTNLEQHKVGTFGFTATDIDELGASGYTLVDIVCDKSGSTSGFQKSMEDALKAAITALKDHPRVDNMMVRISTFNDKLVEVHGYKLLGEIDVSDYDNILSPSGMTALFDSVIAAAEASAHYGKMLLKDDYDVNGILIVITDGMNNSGRYAVKMDVDKVATALQKPLQSECLESYISILIGVNMSCSEAKYALDLFHREAGFTQEFIDLKDASPKTIGRIGEFISESVSSQSQSLATGGVSQSLPTF